MGKKPSVDYQCVVAIIVGASLGLLAIYLAAHYLADSEILLQAKALPWLRF